MDFLISCIPFAAIFFGVILTAIVVLKIILFVRDNKQRKEFEEAEARLKVEEIHCE